MIPGDRISRKQRLRSLRNYKARIAIALAIVLLILIAGKFYSAQLRELLEKSHISDVFMNDKQNTADSLVFQAARSFGLNHQPKADTLISGTGEIDYLRFAQPWPVDVPLIFYARRLKELSEESGIDCDCTQFGKDDSLGCEFASGDQTRKLVVVIQDKRTVLEGRYLGIILKNLYKLDRREIKSIVDSRIPFGYLADADLFPAGEIKKELQSPWAASILRISVSSDDMAKNNIRDKSDITAYRNLASDMLNRHPNPAFMDIQRSERADYAFVEELVEWAKRMKIGYMYRKDDMDGIDRIDSLAFAAGLSFLDCAKITDYSDKEIAEFQATLADNLIQSGNSANMIIMADVSSLGAGNYIKLSKYLKKIGINILYINKLNEHPEFMIEDL